MSEDEVRKNQGYYVSHHAVKNPNKPLRVVYDFSMRAKGKDGMEPLSLNDCLLAGPVIQSSIVRILLGWRNDKFIWTADIHNMFKNIDLDRDDQSFQRMVFRFQPTERLKHYAMTTVSFGATSSPFHAQACVRALARQVEKEDPLLFETVAKRMYMDDTIGGSQELELAAILAKSTVDLLAKGSFPLGKFAANDPKVLKYIPEALWSPKYQVGKEMNVLGLRWNFHEDSIRFEIEEDQSTSDSRREYLSKSAKLFDPLGFLNPIVMMLRLGTKEAWAGTKELDSPLPEGLQSQFNRFKREAPCLNQVQIPRWSGFSGSGELIGFSDASTKGYGCCVYIRTHQSIDLVFARSKVLPSDNKTGKTPTLPFAELKAAVMLAETVKELEEVYSGLKGTRLYTDSHIVIDWLNMSRRYKNKSVEERIKKIKRVCGYEASLWKHVKSKENPADLTTRGLFPNELIRNWEFWIKGPDFLKDWEGVQAAVAIAGEKIEFEELCTKYGSTFDDFCKQFSSYFKLLRIVGMVVKWKRKWEQRKKDPPKSNPSSQADKIESDLDLLPEKSSRCQLTFQDMKMARHWCFKLIQKQFLNKEYFQIEKAKACITLPHQTLIKRLFKIKDGLIAEPQVEVERERLRCMDRNLNGPPAIFPAGVIFPPPPPQQLRATAREWMRDHKRIKRDISQD